MSADDELAAMILFAGGVNCTPGERHRARCTGRDALDETRLEMAELLVIRVGNEGMARRSLLWYGEGGRTPRLQRATRVDEVHGPCRAMRHRCHMRSETPRMSGSR